MIKASVYHKYADQMSKQFYFKQFSLPLVYDLNKVRSLNLTTLLFQAFQYSISGSLILFAL